MSTNDKGKEEALPKGDDRFRLLFESVADALFLHDPQGRFVEVNQAACESLGYTREELLQLPFSNIVKGEKAEALSALWARVLQGEKLTVPGIHQRQDGTAFPVEIHLGPFEYAGRPHILASARDITERLRAEEAQRTSEAFLDSIIDQSPYPMWISDNQGTLIRINQTCRDLLHLNAAEVIGQYNVFKDNIVEQKGLLPLLQRVFEKGETVRFELEYDTALLKTLPLKTTASVILDVTVSPIKNRGGKITNAVFQHVDITQRKRAEEALHKEKMLTEAILDSLPGTFFLIDAQGRHLRTNTSGMVISGYTLEEMSNKHALEFIAEEDRPAAQRAIEEVLDKGEASVEAQMLTKDGRKIPFFFTARKFILDGMPCILGTGLDITERKRTEEALRESEEHYRSLFQNNHSVMLLIDPETGGIMDANPAACSYYGFSRDKLLEKKISDVNTLSAEQVFQEMQRAKTEKRKRFEFRHRLASGEVRDVEVFSGPIRVKGMELLYSIVHDITARKQAEKALQESEKKYRSLYQEFQGILNAIPDVISLISPDLKIVWSNEATVVATQTRSAADLIGKYCYAIRHASSEPCDNCPVLRCFRSGKVETDESVANGWIWELRAVPIYDDHGGLVGAIELARNITERKQMEEALRESQALYQDLVETAQDLIWQCDSEGRYTYLNPAWEEVFGYKIEEMLGKGFADFQPAEYAARDKQEFARLLDGNIVKGLETVHLAKDGRELHLVFNAKFVRDDRGQIVGTRGTAYNITDRKRAEEQRARLEDQMREVQKLESLGVLAGGIAHDFNNLLVAILGNADLALSSLSPASPARPNVEEIARASQRAADLCRQMLAYSGKGRFVVGRYDLSEIVREMAQMLEISVSKKASLRYSFAADLPAVEADATQLRQIIMNLITNASESLGDQKGVISVSTGVMECDRAYLSESHLDDKLPEGRYVYLEVADTGYGMDEETRRRIFDPFFTTKFTGRGLGLAVVFGIVRAHRGAIKVYSEPGQGTSFKILLPAVAWEPEDRAPGTVLSAPLPHGGTVLLVDDDPAVRQVGSQMLERLGFKVLIAAHGREAVEIFRTGGSEIDCVLLDLTMPEMGGDEVFHELRRLRRDVCVILSSGYNEQDVTQRFVGKGLAGFIQKPYTMANLQVTLNRVLRPK